MDYYSHLFQRNAIKYPQLIWFGANIIFEISFLITDKLHVELNVNYHIKHRNLLTYKINEDQRNVSPYLAVSLWLFPLWKSD